MKTLYFSIALVLVLLCSTTQAMARDYDFSAYWDQPDSEPLNLPERGLFWNVRHCLKDIDGSCVVVPHAEIDEAGQPVTPLKMVRVGEPSQTLVVDVQACVEKPTPACSDWSDQASLVLPIMDISQPGTVNIKIEFTFTN